jgi:hypothetical protein
MQLILPKFQGRDYADLLAVAITDKLDNLQYTEIHEPPCIVRMLS